MTAQHNIVVIGGGGAGLRAAIAIAETNRTWMWQCFKVYPMRSHTVSAEAAPLTVTGDDDSLDEFTRTTRYPVATGCVTKIRSGFRGRGAQG